MSLAPEDWKRFSVLSGQLKIADADGDDDVILNAQSGDWVAACEYNDDNEIICIVAMRDYLADGIINGKVSVDGTCEHSELDLKSGIAFAVDRKMDGMMPSGFKIPEHKLNKGITELYGKPDDEGKSAHDSFIESMFHLGRDGKSNMPVLESFESGIAFELHGCKMMVDAIYNRMRDVIGFEIGADCA